MILTVVLRGPALGEWAGLNPDEAELMAEARVARYSPVPFSTWMVGTNGPYSVLFLAGIGALGAPLTPVFAHLLTAMLLALTAAAIFISASAAIGRYPAFVFAVLWWFPLALVFPVGPQWDFGAMSTEYLPVLLLASSALMPRERLAGRPWLFGVLGMFAGLAVGAKYQLAPVAVAFAAAQVIVLRPDRKRLVTMGLCWLAGAMLPALAIVLTMAVSSATNWALVEQMTTFLGDYGGGSVVGKLERTVRALTGPWTYLLVLLSGLIWLARHSDRSANLARGVLVLSGLTAMLIGGRGYGHYNIALFGAIALAATMPVRPGTNLLPHRLAPAALAAILIVLATGLLSLGYAAKVWWPGSAGAAAAAFSPDSVNRNHALSRVCPAGTPVLVWGWAADLYLAQDWLSTVPYQTVEAGRPNADDGVAEHLIRTGIDRAVCVVDATTSDRLPNIAVPRMILPQYYPRLAPVLGRQFHTVSVGGSCSGCTVYVRHTPS